MEEHRNTSVTGLALLIIMSMIDGWWHVLFIQANRMGLCLQWYLQYYTNYGLINFGSANYNDQFSDYLGHALKIGTMESKLYSEVMQCMEA